MKLWTDRFKPHTLFYKALERSVGNKATSGIVSGECVTLRNSKGQFTSEGSKGNQHAKGNPPNKTSFKKGRKAHNDKGVGVPRVLYHSRDGAQSIVTIDEKVDAVSRGKKYKAKRRVSEAQYVMKTPKGMVTYHLDGNPLNNDPSNLEIITRAELMKRNKRGSRTR